MEIGILIGLILTIVILLFLDSRQQKAFRYTEMQLRNALLSHHQSETHLQDKLLEKIEEVNLLQCRQQSTLQQTEIRLRDALLEKIEEVEHLLKQYHTSTLFDYQSPWWRDYSWLYQACAGLAVRRMSTLVGLGSAVPTHAPHLRDTA